MVVFVPFSALLRAQYAATWCFKFSILSPDVVRYMVSRIRRTFSRQIIYMASTILTLYGGTILSDNYNAITLGNGWNTPLGAIFFNLPDRVVS